MLSRISFGQNYDMALRRIRITNNEYQTALQAATSGKKVDEPSDSPYGYRRISQGKADKTALADYNAGTGTAMQEMQVADGVLGTASDAVSRARELAVLGANASLGPDERVALAEEIRALRGQMVQISNTQFNGRFVFAGYQYDQPAFSNAGVYQGDSGVREYIAGLNLSFAASIPGDEIFGTAAGGVDIFATLDNLETALRANNPTGVSDTLVDLQSGIEQLNHSRSIFGARLVQGEDLKSIYASQDITLSDLVSQEEDIDAAQAYSDVAQLSSAMEATLQVTAAISKISLLNYL